MSRFDRRLAAVVAAAFVVGLLLLVGSAQAQVQPAAATHPRWVADSPMTGTWIPTWNTAGTDTIRGLRLIECVAYAETKFTAYYYRSGYVPHKVKWPLYGYAAKDTTYTVPAGETRTYLFDKPWVSYIIVTSGDADFSGE